MSRINPNEVRKVTIGHPKSLSDVIVAIDFGTSRTGVTWGMRKDINNGSAIEVQPLDGAGILIENDKKSPTSILIDKNTIGVKAFGQNAKVEYMSGECGDDYFFQYFKMSLHKAFDHDPKIKTYDNKDLALSTILRESFIYIKNKMIETLHMRRLITHKNPTELIWVLTVPAIWSDAAKSIMRRAAYDARMISNEESDRLIIALEPECAFIASIQNFQNDTSCYAINKKFLMLDCGGGTIDITAHEIIQLKPLKLKELVEPNGGDFGSTKIDEQFFNFIKRFLGNEKYVALKNSETYVDLEKRWEECKINFSFDREGNDYSRINVSSVLLELELKNKFATMIERWNAENPNLTLKKCGGVTLGMSYELMVSFFTRPISLIIDKIKEIIETNRAELNNLNYIIMAGGYSKNSLLHKKLIEEFQDRRKIKIILGREPDLLIVKGAAMLGADPESLVKSRKARYSFGISCSVTYNPSDPLHQKYKEHAFIGPEGDTKLRVFDIHGRKGDDIEVGTVTERQYYAPASEATDKLEVDILKSSLRNPFHISDTENDVLATAVVPIDVRLPLADRGFGIEFSFGTAEVICYVYGIRDNRFLSKAHMNYHKF